MASRGLAKALQQSIRTRTAIRSIQPTGRSYATPVSHGAKTQSTTLSNGFTVRHITSQPLRQYTDKIPRLPPSTRHGLKRRRSVFGSMPVAGRRQMQQTAQLTFLSISHSRYGLKASARKEPRAKRQYRARRNEHNISSSLRLRTWAVISMRTPRYAVYINASARHSCFLARKHCLLRKVVQLRRPSSGRHTCRHFAKLQARRFGH